MRILLVLTFSYIMTSCYCMSTETLEDSEEDLREVLDELQLELKQKRKPKPDSIIRPKPLSTKPLPIKPKPFIDACVDHECCDNRVAAIDLTTGNVHPNFPDGISMQGDLKPGKDKCSRTGLMKINFEAISTSCPCNSVSFFGRRMLKINLFLATGSNGRSGYMFSVGDSITNNGFGGDANSQLYDAEVYGKYPNIFAYTNDICKNEGLDHLHETIVDALEFGIDKVTLYIANGYIRIVYGNRERKICSRCLFGLNDQKDIVFGQDVANTDLFFSFNRVVNIAGVASNRVGTGLCRVEASWVCPEH